MSKDKKSHTLKTLLILGTLIYFLFSLKEIGNFYQTGHAGFINAEVGLSHMNTINNGFLKTKFGATNYKVIYNRPPTKEEYYVRYPYLHNFLMAVLWSMTGPSEIAARLSMILLVFGTFVVLFLMAKELELSMLASTMVYLSLCSFPLFYHYAGLSNGEISALLPLALSFYFYLKTLKQGKTRYTWLLLISISVTCQLFWIGYIAAFAIFADSSIATIRHKQKKSLNLSLALVAVVVLNFSLYIVHTLWMVGSLQNVFKAFLWRSGINLPETQQFTWLDYIITNLKRWWLFNPLVIILACANLFLLFKKTNREKQPEAKKRLYFVFLLFPALFSIVLSHLVQYHDFLVLYFSFFLAVSFGDFFGQMHKRSTRPKQKKALLYGTLSVLLFFSTLGLFKHPEEKLLDKQKDNYGLYSICKMVRNMTTPEDRIMLTLKRVQEPQIRFYLRRDAFFMRIIDWAKDYADSGAFAYYLIENIELNQPVIKYLLQRYRAHKYDRYFFFPLKKPGQGLRVFRREEKETNLLYKYFVSPYHRPGTFREVTDREAVQKILDQFKDVRDLTS